MGKVVSRLGVSRNEKLKNKARAEKMPYRYLADQYAITGFLRRMARSEWSDFFALKGGMMMVALTGECKRPTQDVDLDGDRSLSQEELTEALRQIATIDLGDDDDGLAFDVDKIAIKKDHTAGGLINGAKVKLPVSIGKAGNLAVLIDVGFENVVTPELRRAKLPAQLDGEGDVEVNMYPIETSISEKFRAMVYYGRSNSRLKDFYDIQMFRTMSEFDGEILATAIERSCDKFGFKVPTLDEIPALKPDPENVEAFKGQWGSFLRKNGIDAGAFEECQLEIREFLGPVIDFMNGEGPNPGRWDPEKGWENEVSHVLAM